jgi:hypothetical protein
VEEQDFGRFNDFSLDAAQKVLLQNGKPVVCLRLSLLTVISAKLKLHEAKLWCLWDFGWLQ